ncbi:MAG: hypothetical protein ACR2O0_12795, partial [Rhizobiaceae bacterium]
GNMMRHSLAIYPKQETRLPSMIGFEGVGWKKYVPVRRSNTIVVEENLPPTAAAVLINRAHTQRDIYLPINSIQRKVFDAIDNHRSAAQLAEIADDETVRILLMRLWWYDQIIIDASQQ